MSSIRLDAGSALNLEAAIKNGRQPIFSWTKNNQGLPSYVAVNQNRLSIPRVTKNDEGYYELTITDSNGSTSKGVFVYVTEGTKPTKPGF